MNQAPSRDNIINFKNKIIPINNTTVSRKQKKQSGTRVIAVTSGKGGVGKTNIVANLGYALNKLGKKVLVIDADLGLGNLDVLLGIAPRYNLSHVIVGEKNIREIIVDYAGMMKILPAASGVQELSRLTKEQKIKILTALDSLTDSIDIIIIDTAAGISSNVMYFNMSAQEIIVVVSPEPTSITDAYALMKVLSVKYSKKYFKLLVNMVDSDLEANEVFRQLSLVADRFLDISIEYIGYVLSDKNVVKSVKRQKIFSAIFPETKSSMCFETLAKNICNSNTDNYPSRKTCFFWEYLFDNKFD